MSLAAQSVSATDPNLPARVKQAVIAQAVVVSGEGSGVSNHANRSAYATAVLNFMNNDRLNAWVAAVVSDGTTNAATNDTDLQARVAALWNAFAGGV